MSTYRKRPVEIVAYQWFGNGDHPEDGPSDYEGAVVRYYRDPDVSGTFVCGTCLHTMHTHGWIDTAEGGHVVCPGDWIVTGIKGERYPVKPTIFEATYEPVNEEPVQEDCTLDEASLRVENDRLQESRDEYKEAYNEILRDNEHLRDICKREEERADRAERNLDGLKKHYDELLEVYKETCKYYESLRVQLVSLRDEETERNKELRRGIYRALYSAEPERDSELIWNALREEIEVTKKNEKDFMKLYKRQSEKKAFEDLSEDNELKSQLGESQVEIADLRCALGHWKEAARLAEQELDERDKQVDKLKDELVLVKHQRDGWQFRAKRAEQGIHDLPR